MQSDIAYLYVEGLYTLLPISIADMIFFVNVIVSWLLLPILAGSLTSPDSADCRMGSSIGADAIATIFRERFWGLGSLVDAFT